MMYVAIALALLLAFDCVRMRSRVASLATLPPADAEPDLVFVTAPGVTLDDVTKRAAAAYARANKLAIVDLVPRDLPAIRAMSLAQIVDPVRYRSDLLSPGRTAGHAIAMTRDVFERARVEMPGTEPEFFALAARVKNYAPTAAGFAVAPAERAAPPDHARRFDTLRVLFGPATPYMLLVQPVFWVLMGLSVWLAPTAGLVALGIWHVQPLVALAGSPIHSRDLLVATVFRAPIELYLLARTAIGHRAALAAASARRAEYESEIDKGLDRFFELRRETCPMCDSRDLVVELRNGDLLQHKPGLFTLERCRGCGHVFQNPRLTLDGLGFYYRDFYDGLGEDSMELIFGFGAQPYHERAAMVRSAGTPSRWLDVGAGHGHFCCVARAELPDTRFDGLDLSESIDEAKRRGWIDHAYRGLFPELAPELAGKYDAVTMSHYLEHTLDPRAEIAAARTALAPGGRLMIEVPDPDFRLGRMLGRYWLPWFQPQHQHLVPAKNLDRLLREHGFTPVTWHRGEAHQRVDFFFAAVLLLGRLGPPPKLPWRWRGTFAAVRRIAVWTVGTPFIVGAIVLDNALGLIFSRAKVSNTYRVLATRDSDVA